MKNTKLAKIITLVLSCLLLVGAMIGISVSADDAPTVEIKAKNLSYEGAIKILYAVDAQNVPEGAEVKMYFYNEQDGDVAYEKAAHSEDIQIGDVTYKTFFSDGIAPKNMRAPLYAKAVIVDAEGALLAESAVAEYSIWQYATNRFVKSPSEDQLTLYAAMLDYGASVQKMLVESGKMTEADVIDNGGWIDVYCGIRQDTVYNGATVATGDVTFYRKGEVIALSADNMYGTDGVFADITGSEGNALTTGAYPKATVKASEPGVTAYNANYEVTGYTFRTFDGLCVDGSANDVNVLYKGKSGFDAQNAVGTYVMNGTFGNPVDGTSAGYQRVVADENGNNVYLVGSNGVAAGNAVAYSLDAVVYDADKYIMQFDLNWHGRTDTNGGDPVYFRIENKAMADQNDLAIIYVSDSGTESDTFTFDGKALNKNQNYTIRYEIVPRNRAYFDMYMYVDGELVKTSENVSPATYSGNATGAANNVNAFFGMRFFNRAATNYSYELDNVYLGVEGAEEYTVGNGKHANSEQTFKYNDGTAVSSYVFQGTPGADVAKIENGALNVGQTVIGIKNPGSKTGTRYVYETDFYVDTAAATATATTENLGWWGLDGINSRSKSNQFASYTLGYNAIDGEITGLYIKRNDGATTKLQDLAPNTWYNIRIEYTLTTEYKGYVEFYVDNRLITSYTANGYANGGNITNAEFYGAGFEWRGDASKVSGIRYLYDNTYVAAECGTGAYYSDAEKLGTRYDSASLDSITFGVNGETASSTSRLTSNGMLSVVPNTTGGVDSAFGIANKPIGDATELPTGNVHVFEADIRFDGGYADGAGDLNIGWLGMSSNGYAKGDFFLPLALYGVKGENGIMTAYEIMDHKKGGEVVATLSAFEWYNLRFVYTVATEGEGGTVEVFLNNASVCEYTTIGYSVSDSDTEPNNVFTQFGFQLRSRSASGIGWFEMDMDNIFLGTFTE